MILEKILEKKRAEVALLKKSLKPGGYAASECPPARDFRAALNSRGTSIIAEVKRKSPSKGLLRSNLDPVKLAGVYEQNGAAAISVLTDREFFGGDAGDLRAIRQAVQSPLLRKDFIIDPLQVLESRIIGADAVLLIARLLDGAELRDFVASVRVAGMAALVEVHDLADLEKAVEAGAGIIGINNRDLSTFRTDVRRTLDLLPFIPEGKTIVSESGIHSRAQIEQLGQAGVKAFLVGEALVKEADPASKMKELLGR